jgi:hypothetical protein
MDPRDQAQPPVTGIQTHHARVQPIEADGGRKQRLGEGGIMAVGWGDEAEQGQAGATAEQGMDPVAPQQRPSVMVGGVAQRGIGIPPAPG